VRPSRSPTFSETTPESRFFVDAADEIHPSNTKGPPMPKTTLTEAEIKAIVDKAVRAGVKEALLGAAQSVDDATRAADAAYMNRGWNALATHLHPAEPQPVSELRGPAWGMYNGPGWEGYARLLLAEADQKGKGRP
jgi:hypothetical protein